MKRHAYRSRTFFLSYRHHRHPSKHMSYMTRLEIHPELIPYVVDMALIYIELKQSKKNHAAMVTRAIEQGSCDNLDTVCQMLNGLSDSYNHMNELVKHAHRITGSLFTMSLVYIQMTDPPEIRWSHLLQKIDNHGNGTKKTVIMLKDDPGRRIRRYASRTGDPRHPDVGA